MATVQTLINLASAKCGTDAELGRRAGLSRSQIADFRSGKKAVSPETVALLCDVLDLSGDECREWVAVSIIENPKNASCAEKLRRALFACWVAGVGTLTTANDAQATTGGYMARVDSLYIVAHWLRLLFAPLRVMPGALRAPVITASRMGGLPPSLLLLPQVR